MVWGFEPLVLVRGLGPCMVLDSPLPGTIRALHCFNHMSIFGRGGFLCGLQRELSRKEALCKKVPDPPNHYSQNDGDIVIYVSIDCIVVIPLLHRVSRFPTLVGPLFLVGKKYALAQRSEAQEVPELW